MANDLGWLAVIEGITKGISSGMDKKREYKLEEKKIKSQELTTALSLKKLDQQDAQIALLQQKMLGEEVGNRLTEEKISSERSDREAKRAAGVDKIVDNKTKFLDMKSKLTLEAGPLLKRLSAAQADGDDELVSQYQSQLEPIMKNMQELDDALASEDDRLLKATRGQMGKVKPGSIANPPKQKSVGGAPIGSLKSNERDIINNVKSMGLDPSISSDQLEKYVQQFDLSNLSQEGEAELLEWLKRALMNKSDAARIQGR
jgi:hypothetical protein